MSKVNFLKQEYRTEPEQVRERVGIVDGDNGKPAYTTDDRSMRWIATIDNEQHRRFVFVPVDNNIPIYKSNGKDMESRCDGMLLCFEIGMIAFVELKDVKTGGTGDAIEQLRNTVRLFSLNHLIDVYKIRRAYAANVAHPTFAFSRRREIQEFKNKLGFVLYPQAKITIG